MLCVRVVIKVGVRVPEIKVLQYRFQYHLPIPLVCNQKKVQYRYDTGKYATLLVVSYPPPAVTPWTFDGAISIVLATPGKGLGRMTRI